MPPEFHETHQGRVFFKETLPRMVRAIERLTAALERLAPERDGDEPDTDTPDTKDDEP